MESSSKKRGSRFKRTDDEIYNNKVCDKCYLIECCCEADRIEDEINKKKEIELFHKAKPGSRLWRKILECPCEEHQQNAKNEDVDKSVDIDANVNKDKKFFDVRPNDGKEYMEVRVKGDDGKFHDKWMLRPKK